MRAPETEPGPVEALAHCTALVRDADPDRAVSLLFAPEDRRGPLTALYAFDIETARIRDQVSQPLPGEIRLQWWRDRLAEDGSEGAQGSPVAEALLWTVRRFDLPHQAFERYLEARIFDLYDDHMPTREALEAYAGETASSMMMLAAMILDRKRAVQVADVAGHAGVAETVARILAQAAARPERAHIYIPDTVFEAAGISRARWASDRAPAVGEAMASLAREHVWKAQDGWRQVPRGLRPALLPFWLIDARLKSIAKPVGPFRRSWAYWRAMRAKEGT